MTEAEVFLVLGLSLLAVWSRSILLYIGAIIGSFLMSAHWLSLDLGWTYPAPILCLSFGLLIKLIHDGIKGRIKV